MTTKILGLFTILLVVSFSLTAKEETVKFPVKGECGMCEKRIVNAATSIEGVESANWEQESQTLQVSFNDKKTNVKQIQTSVAMAGHDTEMFSANDKMYAELPGCCMYDRDNNRKKMNHGENLNECDHDINASKGSCCETK